MRKSVMSDGMADRAQAGAGPWRDLERLARVEVSSEDELFPVENALVQRATTGWRASRTGPQVIRMFFDEAVAVRRIKVHVVEQMAERTQEFAVYAGASAAELREVVAAVYLLAGWIDGGDRGVPSGAGWGTGAGAADRSGPGA